MRRIPEWLEQIADGLRDGTDWFVREIRTPPTPVRVIGWLGFQALLFKLQPQLWHLLIEVVQFVASVSAMELHVQLLLVVITILVGQTLLVENRFKLVRKIVETWIIPRQRRERSRPMAERTSKSKLERVTAADGGFASSAVRLPAAKSASSGALRE
jgi:hypothetical protein